MAAIKLVSLSTDKLSMRMIAYFIMAYLCFSLNAFGESIGEQYNKVKEQLKAGGYSAKLLKEQTVKDEAACSHCPKYLDLTAQVNKIVAKLKDQPELKNNPAVPAEVNRLKFLYYVVKAQADDGTVKCSRYLDHTLDLKPTKFDGEMQLMAQDVFKFPGVSQLQVLRPETDEVTYYFRGEGINSNVLIQAVLSKEGGKLKYYQYEPSALEKNPYNLPDLGGSAVASSEVSPGKVLSSLQESLESSEPSTKQESAVENPAETSASLKFKPKLKNLQVAEGDLSHSFTHDGLKLKAKSNLSLKGNTAVIDLSDKDGNIVVVNIMTKLDGSTAHNVKIPYNINITEKDKLKVTGFLLDDSKYQQMTFNVTDKDGPYFTSEYHRNKELNTERMSVSREIAVSAKETVGLSFGRDESKSRYVSISHKKTLSENVTVVMDLKVNRERVATIYYSLSAKF